jgi:acyl-CoA dehydrogenase
MPLQFRRSWSDEEVERFRDSWARFVESDMLPQDEEARRRGHVGHALWRKAGTLGFLCVDIPEGWGGGGGDFRHEAVIHEETARRALTGMSIGVHSIVAHYPSDMAPRTKSGAICRSSPAASWSGPSP